MCRRWLLIGMLLLSACGANSAPPATTQPPPPTSAALATSLITPSPADPPTAPAPQATAPPVPAFADLHGSISIDGSSTVFPITEAIAQQFQLQAPQVEIRLGVSGTGGGFKKFCASEILIANASRPIKSEEAAECEANNVEFIEVPVAFDGVSVVVHRDNTWAECMTVTELQHIWEPKAEGQIKQWSDVHPSWPNQPLTLFGAGADSGTYDYFTAAIVGKENSSRSDYVGSEDDYLLAQDIAAEPNALGFFGYAYYHEYQDQLRLVALDAGQGCIAPSPQTIADGTYQPLSRPIFIYINNDALENSAIATFAKFYLDHAAEVSQTVRYVPLPPRAYTLAQKRLDQHILGSLFDGGSQIGVSIEQLLELEGR